MEQDGIPDLTGAEVFVEAAKDPIAGGRWYILASNGEVVYQRPSGEYDRNPVVKTHDLRSSPTWRLVDAELRE